MVNTIFADMDGKCEQLSRAGYVIVRNVVPVEMLEQFRHEAEALVDRARARDPSWETTAQPRASMTADSDEQTIATVDFLLHDNTYGFSAQLLGCPREQVALKIALVLCNPEMTPDQPPRPGQTWGTDPRNWHRDVRPDRDGPLQAHLNDVEANGPGYVQWNVALYEDHVLYVVPGSHRRLNSQIERSHLGAEHGRLTPLPESRRVDLGPGDGVVYNNHALHWGSKYTPAEQRRTLHFGYRSFGTIYPSQRHCHLPAGFWETFAEGTPQRQVTDHWLSLNLAEFATIEDMFRGVMAGDSNRFRRGLALLHPAQAGRVACLILLTKVAAALQGAGSEGAHTRDSTVYEWQIRQLAAKFTQDELDFLWERFAPVDNVLKTGGGGHVTGFLGPSTDYEFERVPAGMTAEGLCAAIVAGDCSSLAHG